MDKHRTTAIINDLYELADLPAPLIIWTQSPLESYLARAAIDVFCEESQQHSWVYRWWERASKGAMGIRKNAVRSLIESGWNFGGIGTGYPALTGLTVYSGSTIPWEEIPPTQASHFQQAIFRNRAGFKYEDGFRYQPDFIDHTRDLDPAGVSNTVDLAIEQHQNDFIIDIRSRYKFQMDHIGRERIGGSRNMHLQMSEDKRRLLCQKNLGYFPTYVPLWFGNGLQMTDEFIALRECAGHVMPFTNICFVSEKASCLKLNRAGRLHCETGPATAYSDGFEIYAWDGVIFPAIWIKEKPSPREAFTWPNTEQRRIACEMVGWDNIIKVTKAKVVNKDTDPEIGELLSVDIPGIGDEKFLRVTCGTGRIFVLPVPPNMKTAHEANAWTWGLEPSEYQPEVRT